MGNSMKTKVVFTKSKEQKDNETTHVIIQLKELIKSFTGEKRAIKLPQYIFFKIEKNTLYIDIQEVDAEKDGIVSRKNPACENMQTDNAAFEGWAICLKAWLSDVDHVTLSWVKPSNVTLHYNRFLYRVLRFKEAFSEWFKVSDKNIEEVNVFERSMQNLMNNSYSAPPQKKQKKNGEMSETLIEYRMVNDWSEQMKKLFSIDFIDRQFSIGVKQDGKQFFTGGMSAIDLWGINEKEKSVTVIELKYVTEKSFNAKVGIVSELFLYACAFRDIIRGLIQAPESCPKTTESQFYEKAKSLHLVKARMLSNNYHPLVDCEEVFLLLNRNSFDGVKVDFGKCNYDYKDSKLVLPTKI